MTHVPESKFMETVEEYFDSHFPDATIHTGYDAQLDKTGRYPDLIIEDSWFGDFVVEVENDFEAAFKGVGQACVYAGETGYTPVLVVPEGHTEEPEWGYMKQFVHCITVSPGE